MAKSKPVGIDLGTTYSAMAWVNEATKSVLIPNEEGDLITPSVVLFEDQSIVVGKEAKKVAVLSPDRVATCVKRDMGKNVYSRPIRGRYLPPEVIQSYILKKLKDDVTRAIGPDFRPIITVPAYFDEPRRNATWQAGEMAGLKVLDIVNEPTAAALAFGEDMGYLTRFGAPRERMKVIVYDLGGGTFDVTLIDMQAGDLRTLATDGDVQLGGYDWDMRLVDLMAEAFQRQHGVDPRLSPSGLQRMLLAAEEAKHTLSARSKTTVHLAHESHVCDITIRREEFEDRTADLLERTRHTTKQLLGAAKLDWKDIRRILLTGGSTRMPMVVRMLRDLSGIEPDMSVNPDEAVARGAAVYANYLLASKGETGHAPTFDVTNVNAHSLGVEGIETETLRKRNKILIRRNTPLPARKLHEFITKEANQQSVVVQVLEGESKDPEECTPIGRTVIRDLPKALPRGTPVDVTYEYGVNGRLSVKAKVRGTDREVQLELERDDSMSADRVNRWKKHVAEAGGLDAFDMAILEELDGLKKKADETPVSAARPTATALPLASGAPRPAVARAAPAPPPPPPLPRAAPPAPPTAPKPLLPKPALAAAAAPKPNKPQSAGPAATVAAMAVAAAAGKTRPSLARPAASKSQAKGLPGWLIAVACGLITFVALGLLYIVAIRLFPGLPLPGAAGEAGRAVVVGVQSAALFEKSELAIPAGELSAGTVVEVLEVRGDAVQVSASGQRGWTLRSNLATASEYKQRQGAGQIPTSVMCVASQGEGVGLYGTIPIREGDAALVPGTAVWLDSSMRGKTYTLGDQDVRGDPNQLHYIQEDGTATPLDLTLPAAVYSGSER